MTTQAKIRQLQENIESQLSHLITRDYWLLNVPYHPNVGDTLIWQGELDFLMKFPYKCKGMRSFYSPIPKDIIQDELILIHGGGNFGDVWELPQEWQMSVVKQYPNNTIIFFPQTIWFEHEENMKKCAKILNEHQHLTICARDNNSYNILSQYFDAKILLVPDMAFCINMSHQKVYPSINDTLLLKRADREYKETYELNKIEHLKNITISDWKTFDEDSWQKRWLRRTKKYLPMFPNLYDFYAYKIFRPYLVNSGIKLISSYKRIYSTRLHAIILSLLLGKDSDLYWFDNSYGKNRNFYDTWLSDLEGITFIK